MRGPSTAASEIALHAAGLLVRDTHSWSPDLPEMVPAGRRRRLEPSGRVVEYAPCANALRSCWLALAASRVSAYSARQATVTVALRGLPDCTTTQWISRKPRVAEYLSATSESISFSVTVWLDQRRSDAGNVQS